MGITPRLKAQPDFPAELLGYSMSAFYGGRAEVHLRRVPVPVALVDFTSMYPTVDNLMGIWELVTAATVEAIDVTDEITTLLAVITRDDCFQPERWRDFVVIVGVVPDGDVLPVRADYQPDYPRGSQEPRSATTSWSIGVKPLHADEPFWYTLPDLVASKMLSGRTPQVRRAFRFVPAGGRQGERTC
jgi:hypothetical protein